VNRQPSTVNRQLLLVALFCATTLHGQSALNIPTPQTDPTEFGSLALDPSEALVVPRGRLVVSIQTSYFNQWGGSWHTARIHRDQQREGQPLSDEEIAIIDRDFGGDSVSRVDVEGWRLDTLVAVGLGRATLSARIPWITIGTPNGDPLAEAFHDVIPVSENYERDIFARGQTLVLIRGAAGAVTARSELDQSGIGDAVITISAPVTRHHVAALSISAPTGKADTLHGSGGWDSGIRWFSSWSGGRRHYAAGMAYNRLDRSGDFLGLRRSDTWNLYGAVEQPLGARWSAVLRGRVDSSPLDRIIDDDLGKPAFFYRLGLVRAMNSGRLLSIELGEELAPQWGLDADFSLHVSVTQRVGS
jgi:hypothetical protein